MADIFAPILQGATAPNQIFRQPSPLPVDNSTADTINAAGNLLQVGSDAYKQYTQKQTLSGLADEASKYQAAVAQGTMKPADAYARMSSSSSAAITANPLLAPEIRSTITDVMGTDPTVQQMKDLNHARELDQTQSDTTADSLVIKATAEGYVKYNSDGTLNTADMQQYGIKAFARDQQLEMQKKIKESNPTEEQRSTAFQTAYEPHYDDLLNSKTDVLVNTVDQMPKDPVTGLMTPAQQRDLNIRSQAAVENSVQQLRLQVINAGGTSKDADGYEKRFRDSAGSLLKNYTGENSDPNLLNQNLKYSQDASGFKVSTALPTLTGASAAGIHLTPIDVDTFNDDLKQHVAAGGQSTLFYASSPKAALTQDATDAFTQGKPLGSYIAPAQTQVVNSALANTKAFGVKDFNTLNPDERKAAGLSLNVLADASKTPATDADSAAFADIFSKPSTAKTLEGLSSNTNTADIPKQIAATRLPIIENALKNYIAKNPKFTYDKNTDTIGGNPYMSSLLKNIDTLYPYSGNTGSVNDYKAKLLGKDGLFD